MKIDSVKVTHHGRTVDGDFYQPEGVERFPAVVVSHGFNGHKSSFGWLAAYLAENGIGAVSITFCGGGSRDESGFPTTSMSVQTEKEDVLAVAAWLRSHPQVDESRVYLFGESQGGMASVLAAAEQPELAHGLILLYPALCIPDDWRKLFPVREEIPETIPFWNLLLGKAYALAAHDLDVFSVLPGYHGPVLLMHGEKDTVVNVSYAKRAAELYDDVDLHLFPEEGHGFKAEASNEMKKLTLAFINKH